MAFNPFRVFKNQNKQSTEDYMAWDSPPTDRRKMALIAVGVGVSLFGLAVFLLSSPTPVPREDAAALKNSSKPLVGADSQKQSNAPMPTIAAKQKVSAAQCSQRRLQLTGDSQSVDRFDLKALEALNRRIGLYNQDCADSNTTAKATGLEPGKKTAEPSTANVTKKSKVVSVTVNGSNPKQQAAKETAKSEPKDKKAVLAANGQADQAGEPKWNPTVLSIQSLLKKQGFDPGPNDGLMGRRTRDAVKAFQTQHGLTADGLVTLELLEQVLEAHPNSNGKTTFSASDGPIVQKQKSAPELKPAVKKPAPANKPALTKTTLTPPLASAKSAEKKAGSSTWASTEKPTDSSEKVTLESLNDFERQTIQWVCAGQASSGQGTYDECLQDQVARGRRVGKPDLSKLNPFERQAVTRLCATARYEQGLAAYYECATRQRDSVTAIARRPNVGNLGIDVRGAVRRNCDGLQFTESLPVYYRCVDTQIARAKR